MSINISIPDVGPNLHPQITVLGVGGSGGNAVNNMMNSNLEGVEFLIANTDAQALQISNCKKKIQLGIKSTRGLGAGMRPDIGKQAAEEAMDEIVEKLEGSHMLFIAAGMGGGTGTGAAPVIAKLAREKGILTVGVVTKPFHFEGIQRMKLADKGLEELQQFVDTLLTIPNQNLFRIANEKTTFADAFKMADDVLYAGVRGVTDLMVQPGLINLDFSDVKTVMSEMGKAMMGTGEASGDGRAIAAAEAAIANPLIDDVSLKGARGLIINITGGNDITLYEVDEAANRIKEEVDENANIIYGTTCDERLEGVVRVSIVATGIDASSLISQKPIETLSSISINNAVYQKNSLEESNGSSNNHSELYLKEKELSDKNELIENNKTIDEENNSLENQNFAGNNFENVNLGEEPVKNYREKEEQTELDNYEMQNNELENRELTENLEENLEENPEDILSEENNNISSTSEFAEQVETKNSVKRLSLFDHIDQKSVNEKSDIAPEEEKSEPMFENQIKHDDSKISDSSAENEIEPKEISDDTEFNQETEEELLDIPTFLRRQAN